MEKEGGEAFVPVLTGPLGASGGSLTGPNLAVTWGFERSVSDWGLERRVRGGRVSPGGDGSLGFGTVHARAEA